MLSQFILKRSVAAIVDGSPLQTTQEQHSCVSLVNKCRPEEGVCLSISAQDLDNDMQRGISIEQSQDQSSKSLKTEVNDDCGKNIIYNKTMKCVQDKTIDLMSLRAPPSNMDLLFSGMFNNTPRVLGESISITAEKQESCEDKTFQPEAKEISSTPCTVSAKEIERLKSKQVKRKEKIRLLKQQDAHRQKQLDDYRGKYETMLEKESAFCVERTTWKEKEKSLEKKMREKEDRLSKFEIELKESKENSESIKKKAEEREASLLNDKEALEKELEKMLKESKENSEKIKEEAEREASLLKDKEALEGKLKEEVDHIARTSLTP